MKDQTSEQNLSDESNSWAEKFSSMIASLIVITLLGLVIYSWRTGKDTQPLLNLIETETIRQEQGQFYVPFTVKNEGGKTAESVQVIGELYLNGELIESGEQQIDYLSEGESASGAFVFSQNPQQGELKIRVASYKLP